ncbi:MAG: hypothetical protein WC538_21270 [Thermoanaerobaculia bacterium]
MLHVVRDAEHRHCARDDEHDPDHREVSHHGRRVDPVILVLHPCLRSRGIGIGSHIGGMPSKLYSGIGGQVSNRVLGAGAPS